MDRKRFDVLDGMRGAAAIGVMVGHIGQHIFHHLFSSGMAVDIFFILSGFVLSYSYGERLASGLTCGQFVRIRLIRLYPMFLFGLLLGAPVLYASIAAGFEPNSGFDSFSQADVARTVLENAVFLPYLSDQIIMYGNTRANIQIVPVNDPLWSLIFEMAACLAFVVLYKLGRFRLLILSIVSFCTICAYGLVYSSLMHSRFDFELGWGKLSFAGGFARVLYGFSLGMFIFAALPDIRRQRWTAVFSHVKGCSFILYALMFVALDNTWTLRGVFPLFGISVVAPCLIIAGALSECGNRLERNIAKFFGWISYPLYCVHYPVLRLTEYLYLKHVIGGLSPRQFILTVVFASVALAIVVAKLYDEPVRNFLSRRTSPVSAEA